MLSATMPPSVRLTTSMAPESNWDEMCKEVMVEGVKRIEHCNGLTGAWVMRIVKTDNLA
jgi:hypothetical protein